MARHPISAVIASFTQLARPTMRRFMTRASCIGAARTTLETMRVFGLEARALPVMFLFQVPARGYGRICGVPEEERRELVARSPGYRDVIPEGPGGWNGHLVVLVENRWLLDPSIDQVEEPEFGVYVPPMVFTVDTIDNPWNPAEDFEIKLGLRLDNNDEATLLYRSIQDQGYLETEAWTDEGLPLLAHAIAVNIERSLLEGQRRALNN